MNKKGNRGYQDTDKRICDYVLKQMETIPLHEITVQSVCKDLDINRSTFYVHFQDIYAVAESIAEQYNDILKQIFNELGIRNDTEPKDYTLAILRHIKDNQTFYRNAFTDDFSLIIEKHFLLLRQIIDPIMRSYNIQEAWLPYYFTYSLHGFLAVVELWLNNKCRERPEEIAEIVFSLNPDRGQYWIFR